MQKNSKSHITLGVLAGLLLFAPLRLTSGLVLGEWAQEFELPDLNGKTVSLSNILQDDKPVILSFFGTWCDSCQKEISDLPEVIKGRNVAVYLVGVDGDKEKLERFVSKRKIQFPVLWDPKAKTMGKKYGLMRGAFVVVPKIFIISPTGTIEYVSESYDDKRKASLEDKIARLSNKQWQKISEVAIFFTGSINGYLESCNCYKHPYGGLIKLVSLFKQQTSSYKHTILLDSGDFLPYGVTAAQAALILKAMAAAKYDAIAAGDQELVYSDLAKAIDNEKLPILTSNVKLNGAAPGMMEKTITAGDIKVRVVSYANPETFSLYSEDFAQRLAFGKLQDELKAGKKADILVLLAHAGLAESKRLAAEFPQIDLIIAGHSQELLKTPIRVGDTNIVQSGGNLQNMGRIVLYRNEKGQVAVKSYQVFPLSNDIPNAPEIEAILKESKGLK
ncbi:MAG: redoxin domain-containing protein [Elusimicrobiales bacterium]|nr:redoxin domain-containing protein [Elusimicrobiales bacterium]